MKTALLITAFLASFVATLAAQASECTPITKRFAVDGTDLDKSTYQVTMQACKVNDADVVSLRRFKLKGEMFNWIVSSKTLQTGIIPEKCLKQCAGFDSNSQNKYANILTDSTRVPSPTAGAGIQKAKEVGPGQAEAFLTIDLCPSSKKLQTEIFERIQSGYMTNVPVALSVSGLWIKNHHDEFVYLLQLQDQKKINITWVNHSLTHPYDQTKGIEENFLLTPGIDFQREVLGNEMVMFSQGLVPSIFFRFPGLISSDKLIDQLKAWGLIPLGANAWLGKGQKIKNGSIVLVHGNGNELSGLTLLYKALEVQPQINATWTNLNQVYNSVTDKMESVPK
ncbi:hypothetical protein CIK05_13105 [Bdellovibrio sp. qaytius]|nr:hypothetical protein CIK05_13105 [Bdellovibrio sp. qaytius]